MKKSLITLALCASALIAQPTQVAIAGAKTYLNQRITFGGNSYVNLTSGKDTLSDPISMESATIRPGEMMALEYFAIAADSANSEYRIDIQSRICTNGATSVGCPTQWLLPRFRRIFNTGRYADSVTVSLVPQDTTQFSHSTIIPTGNQTRLRIRVTSGSQAYLRDIFWRGF